MIFSDRIIKKAGVAYNSCIGKPRVDAIKAVIESVFLGEEPLAWLIEFENGMKSISLVKITSIKGGKITPLYGFEHLASTGGEHHAE